MRQIGHLQELWKISCAHIRRGASLRRGGCRGFERVSSPARSTARRSLRPRPHPPRPKARQLLPRPCPGPRSPQSLLHRVRYPLLQASRGRAGAGPEPGSRVRRPRRRGQPLRRRLTSSGLLASLLSGRCRLPPAPPATHRPRRRSRGPTPSQAQIVASSPMIVRSLRTVKISDQRPEYRGRHRERHRESECRRTPAARSTHASRTMVSSPTSTPPKPRQPLKLASTPTASEKSLPKSCQGRKRSMRRSTAADEHDLRPAPERFEVSPYGPSFRRCLRRSHGTLMHRPPTFKRIGVLS